MVLESELIPIPSDIVIIFRLSTMPSDVSSAYEPNILDRLLF